MKIIIDQAEEQFSQTIHKTRQGLGLSNYCLHIRGQSLTPQDFKTLPELIVSWLGQSGGEMFICHDYDIFVLSPNLSEKTYATLKEHFQVQFQLPDAAMAKTMSFYHITENHLGLIDLADLKLAKKTEWLKKEDARKIESLQKKVKDLFYDMHLNHDLVATLHKRRSMRAHLEILIVDDDAFSRQLIYTSLSKMSVSVAENAHAAVVMYLQRAPDIIFLDINLPDVSGHDVLSKILSFDPDAYIVMLSGDSHSENVTSAIKAGAKGFVGKPFTKEKLLQYIGKCPRNQQRAGGV